jgi:MFS family permease
VTGPPEPGLRGNRNWMLLWAGQGVSLVGDFVLDITIVLWISTVIARGLSWAPAAVSGVLIAAAVPALLLGPVAGVFVDRWDRRRTMMTADACRALLILLLLPLAWPSVAGELPRPARVALIYLVVAAASCFAQFFNPSRFAMLGAVVHQKDMPRASGQFQATGSLASIIGPPLAAPLLFVFGVQWALVIDAATFLVSFATIRAIRVPGDGAGERPGEQAGFWPEFRAGLRFFAGSRVLVALTAGIVLVTLGSGALNALNVFFVTHNLHVTAKWYGTIEAGVGAGAVLGALGAGWIAGRIGSARVLWGGLVLAGLLIVGYSRTGDLAAAIVVMAFVGLAIGAVNTALSPLLLRVTPQEMIGRVIAVNNPIQQAAAISSMAASGFLASTALRGLHAHLAGMTFGPYDTIFAVAGLLIVLGGLSIARPLRDAESGQATEPAEEVPTTPAPG